MGRHRRPRPVIDAVDPRSHTATPMLSLPGPNDCDCNMATWDERTPGIEKVGPPADLHTTVDRVLWEARTYGGYTVPVSSMTPGEAAKVVEELRRDDLRFRHRGARNDDKV